MKTIGNVLYHNELFNHTKVDYINYYNSDYDNIDYSLPTLVVGWDFLKKKYGEDFSEYGISILDKELIKNEFYWEFSFDEKKSDHISGVDMFVRNVPYYYFRSKYIYTNLDPIFNKITNIDEFKKLLPEGDFTSYQFKDEMIYLLKDIEIFGIDLEMYNFFNIDSYGLLSSLTSKISEVNHDVDGSIYQKYYKTYPNFEELKRYLVVLLSKP